MKAKSVSLTLLSLLILLMSACSQEPSTKVSKNIWGDTVVATPTSSGTFTRTTYSTNWYGKDVTTVTRGHENATQQQDAMIALGKILAECFQN